LNFNWDIVSQVWITIFGCSAIYLVGRLDKWKKYGYLLGLFSQPAWYITSYINEQWGILFLSLWYTYSWANGFYNYWYKEGSI